MRCQNCVALLVIVHIVCESMSKGILRAVKASLKNVCATEGMVIEDPIVFSSSSWLLLESCLFKELTLPQPYANQVFEHAGMWRPIVRPIM